MPAHSPSPLPPSPELVRTALRSYFWAILLLGLGSIVFSTSEILRLSQESDDATFAMAQLQPQLKDALYQHEKLSGLVAGLLHLAPTDPAAAHLVALYKIPTPPPKATLDTGKSGP